MNEKHFVHHDAGLINQLMSVELICGIAHILQEKVYVIKPYWRNEMPICISGNSFKKLKSIINNNFRPYIYDIIDYPNNLIEFKINPDSDYTHFGSLVGSYVDCDSTKDNFDEEFFSEGRTKIVFGDGKYLLKEWCFGFYSRFFYHRTKELDKVLSSIRFKKEYTDLALKIAKDIGMFHGLHVRGTDHRKNCSLDKDVVNKKIQELVSNDGKVVVCTDEEVDYKNCILLHNFIIENYADSFKKLSYSDAAIFSLINLLVMTHSEDFYGTPGSTFSAYIHRSLYLKKPHSFKFIDGQSSPPHELHGRYSWNGFNMHTIMKSWWREWPECKLDLSE